MALATVFGNIRDFTGEPVAGARMWVHPRRPGSGGSSVFVDSSIEVPVAAGGAFSLPLEEFYTYQAEIVFPDPERSRSGLTLLPEFTVPVGGGPMSTVMGLPAGNGWVRVLRQNPTSVIWDQYVYNELTGDLYERTS